MHEPQRLIRSLIPFGVVILGLSGHAQDDMPAIPAMAAAGLAPASTAETQLAPARSTAVLWAMTPHGDAVRDPSSGLTLALGGQWAAAGDAVRFGASGGTGLGTADDHGRLSPGSRDFAVAVRLTSSAVPTGVGYSPNVIQKGFAASGGQWKLTLRPTPSGTRAACRFEGRRGSATVIDGSPTRIDDGSQHDVECWRQGPRVGISVDARATSQRVTVGAISPRTPTTVANKKASAGVDDQFNGSLFCVAMVTGTGSRRSADALLDC